MLSVLTLSMLSVGVDSVQGFGVCVDVSRLKRESRAGESGEGRKRAWRRGSCPVSGSGQSSRGIAPRQRAYNP